MFIRVKGTEPYQYLQVVENYREGKNTRQRVLCTLGRLDHLAATGATDSLLRSLGRFAQQVRVVEGYNNGELEAGVVRQIGPDLAFGRLWQSTGMQSVLTTLLKNRHFDFPVERAVYLSVLHRILESGSDRSCERWKRDLCIPGTQDLRLHHLYRAMRWVGENKDAIEEALFHRRRDLFTEVSLAFFDTTSTYFEGQGGESLGRRGPSKDRRPDEHQMVVGAVLTGEGRPVCCELWPGNRVDSQALLPVVDRLDKRFGLKRVCWVADRGMISKATIEELERREKEYILGARMRRQREVSEVVLGRAGRYHKAAENLWVKEVWVEGRRYVMCYNPQEAARDEADRKAIVESLEEEIKKGNKQLIGNRGYRRFVRAEKGAMSIDRKKVREDRRYDGKFVLRTNTALTAEEVAVQYKRLLLVEQFFRAAKSLVDTRPVFHQWDATIKGHVFCSFLALALVDEMKRRLAARGWQAEWDEICQDLEALSEVEVRQGEDTYLLRTPVQGVAGKVLQTIGVAIPPSVRRVA